MSNQITDSYPGAAISFVLALLMACSAGSVQNEPLEDGGGGGSGGVDTGLGGASADPCSRAASSRSYQGCEYWPTPTGHLSIYTHFNYAVVVANANDRPAQVTVSTASNAKLRSVTVAAGGVATIKLPWIKDLMFWPMTTAEAKKPPKSALSRGSAYHLISTLPVSVYQFSPLEYVVSTDCHGRKKPGAICYSYTSDASLLLPQHALGKEYMVLSRATNMYGMLMVFQGGSPGFFSVVATRPGTTRVEVTFTAPTQAGTSGLSAYAKGQTASFQLSRGDVLQILSHVPTVCAPDNPNDLYKMQFCNLNSTTDLTGTVIKADRQVAVYSGHNGSCVPYNKFSADHLEEQLPPTSSWGRKYVAAHTRSSGKDPNVYRVVAARDSTRITFIPPVRSAVTLKKGQWVELTTTQDFVAQGNGRFALVQFMVGQNYSTPGGTNPNPGDGSPGDPSMALAVPVEQYRSSYAFLAPATYPDSYVNVIAASSSAVIQLDGKPLAASTFKAIGSTGFRVAKVKIPGGAHRMQSTSRFGIAVYGVAPYTSYMYPGGMDLRQLY